jgi:hypothetical protein
MHWRAALLILLVCPATLTATAQAQVLLRDYVVGNGCGQLKQKKNFIMTVTVGQACVGGHGVGFWRTRPTSTQTGIGEGAQEGPLAYRLSRGFPNPFYRSTRLAFDVPDDGHVAIHVFDIRGRLVRTLVDRVVSAGRHEAVLEETGLPGGIYWVRMRAGGVTGVQRVVLLR